MMRLISMEFVTNYQKVSLEIFTFCAIFLFLVNCLADLSVDSCVDLKNEIIQQPNFDIFDRIQEMCSNIIDFIFNLSDNISNKIDKVEFLFTSRYEKMQKIHRKMKLRPTCDETMKLKQLSNVLNSLAYTSYSIKSKLQNYQKSVAARKIPKPPPDFSKEIKQLSSDIMDLFTAQMEDAMKRMNFLIKPTFTTQLEYLKIQVKFEHVKKLNERFEGLKDDITDDLQEQIEIFGSVYQFYSFVQANAIDSMITLNDRFEYETLWRFPIQKHLGASIGEKNELSNTGHLKLFSDLEQILEEMNLEHSEFESLSSIGVKRDKSLRFNFTENSLESFYMKGGLLVEINPLDYNCYDCFNPRLNFIEMHFTTEDTYKKDKMNFEVIHMGAELFPIMEGGVRQITFFQNSPKKKF